MLPRFAVLLLSLLPSVALTAQQPPARPATPDGQPVHRAGLRADPQRAFDHVRSGNRAHRDAKAKGVPAPAPAARPAGFGRYLCAVIACPDAGADAVAALGLRSEDVLLIQTPAAQLGAGELALLERAVATHQVPLCIVLTHDRCASLADDKPASKAQEQWQRATAPARERAARERIAVELAQALRQAELLKAQAEALRAPLRDGRFRIVPATLDVRSGAITWHHAKADDLPLAPVK